LRMRWSYSSNVHERATVERLVGEFVGALDAFLEVGGLPGADASDGRHTNGSKLDEEEFISLLGPLSAAKREA
jgi:hypothetical protein